MQPDELLASLKARFAGNKAGGITISADEIAEWPRGVIEKLLEAKLLAPAEPAQALECRGCEEACFMPVNIVPAEGKRPARAFIACDKPVNYGRIRVDFARLRQWQMTRAAYEKLQNQWIVPPAAHGKAVVRRSKAPVAFRGALEALLVQIEKRAAAQGLPFDRHAMPGRKVDFQALAEKIDAKLEYTPRTFDDYLEGLCAFKRGARQTDFYTALFPEYFK